MSFLSTVNGHLSTDQRATGGTRTHDPSLTKRLLCQLSYGGLRRLQFASKLACFWSSAKEKCAELH